MSPRSPTAFAALALLGLALRSSVPSVHATEVVLQDGHVLAAFDPDSGALTRLENKATHWSIERRPELGISFRLHHSEPGEAGDFILGEKQRAAEVTMVSDHQVRLRWENLVDQRGETLPLAFAATVTLDDGKLTFSGELTNHSNRMVETIEYPCLGNLESPGPERPMTARTMWYGDLLANEIYPKFVDESEQKGRTYPKKVLDSSRSLFCLIQSEAEGLYVAMEDPTQSYLMQFVFEQHPGAPRSQQAAASTSENISGSPAHLAFRACHYVFARGGSTAKLAPVVLQPYEGDWHAGVDLYKRWRATWFRPPHLPDWARSVHSWQELQLNSPEQNYGVSYADLVRVGEECARAGVGAIQVVGWNHQGQDADNPSLDPEPKLGTWQQLHDAIAQIQAHGVKVILFGKFPWADMTTRRYKEELYKYSCIDPSGVPYENDGDSYFTPTQLAGINNHRFAVMDFLDANYRRIAADEFAKTLALGASGFLYDEVPTHTPVFFNFAPGHGYTPPGFIYAGDIPMARQLHAVADARNPDFLFAGEAPQDWLMQYYPFSYFRINRTSTPVSRYIDPQAPLMVAVIGFDNREMLNLCLLDRYVISYEPYNFKGRLPDIPLTLAYGKKIDALRNRYKAYLWDADFRDTVGATVTVAGAGRYPVFITQSSVGQGGGTPSVVGSYRYSIFVTSAGKRAMVLVNQDPSKPITAQVDWPQSGKFVVVTPENPEPQPATGTVQVAARSAAVLMEQ